MGYSKSSPKWKIIVTNTYVKKEERFQISNLSLQLRELEKEEQTKPKTK